MAYCSIGDLRAATGREMLVMISDRDNDGIEDTAVINAAISWGQGKIDGKLSARYSVPLGTTPASTPNTINQINVDLAKWRLLKSGVQTDGFLENVSPTWEADYNDSMEMLANFATGVMRVPSVTATGVKPEVSIGLAGDDVERQFTMTHYAVGGDSIDTDEEGSMDTW